MGSPSSGPRRMQCGWCETRKSGEEILLVDESNRFLKKIIRANAQVTILKKGIVVPNVFEADWGCSLYDTCHPQGPGRGLQQLLLPLDLVKEDDTKVSDAPSKLKSLADTYLKSLQRSDISLTKASMNIPDVWNLAIAGERVADLVTEELETVAFQTKVRSPSSVPPSSQPDRTADRSELLVKAAVSEPREPSPSTNDQSKDHDNVLGGDQLAPIPAKLKDIAEDNPLSTDYLLSDKFLRCNWSEPSKEINSGDILVRKDVNSNGSKEISGYDQFLQQIARPALWDLMRKKMLQVGGASFQRVLNCISLNTLEAIIYQQFREVKERSLNPSAFSSVEIIEACTSLRQAAWLHTLRIVSISQAGTGGEVSTILTRILSSTKYKLILGHSNWRDLHTLLEAIGGCEGGSNRATFAVNEVAVSTQEEDPTLQQPHKRQRVLQIEKESIPVRVMCSVEFLEQDELLDELCTEHQIFFIERDLPCPLDMLVDERNCICIVAETTFQAEDKVRDFIFSLARLQVQIHKCWLVMALEEAPSTETENMMSLFFAALVQFRIKIQVFTSFSCEETGRLVRSIVDECAKVALSDHRILPRLWFERPFLLEEESQFERFLVSTTIVNHFAAQSLLHKICMVDLFSKRLEELKLLVQHAVTNEQLELLWGLLRQDHGLNGAAMQ